MWLRLARCPNTFFLLDSLCQWPDAFLRTLPPSLCVCVCVCVCVLNLSIISNSFLPCGLYPKGSSLHGIFHARIREWVAISYSRESSEGVSRVCPTSDSVAGVLGLGHFQANPDSSDGWYCSGTPHWLAQTLSYQIQGMRDKSLSFCGESNKPVCRSLLWWTHRHFFLINAQQYIYIKSSYGTSAYLHELSQS